MEAEEWRESSLAEKMHLHFVLGFTSPPLSTLHSAVINVEAVPTLWRKIRCMENIVNSFSAFYVKIFFVETVISSLITITVGNKIRSKTYKFKLLFQNLLTRILSKCSKFRDGTNRTIIYLSHRIFIWKSVHTNRGI